MVSAILIHGWQAAAFAAFGIVFAFMGARFYRRAREFADSVEREAATHPWQRLWLPARWWTSDSWVWQFRLTAVFAVLFGIAITILCLAGLILNR